jgi:hypothetical protein
MQVIVAARRTGKTTYAKMIQKQEGARCLRLVPSIGLGDKTRTGDCTTYNHYLTVLKDQISYRGFHSPGNLDPLQYTSLICEEPSLADEAFKCIAQYPESLGHQDLPKVILAIGTPVHVREFFYQLAIKHNAVRWTHTEYREDAHRYLGSEYYPQYHAKFLEEL